MSRLIGEHMSRTLGQTVLSRTAGAGGTLITIASPARRLMAPRCRSITSRLAAPSLFNNLRYTKPPSSRSASHHAPMALIGRKTIPGNDPGLCS